MNDDSKKPVPVTITVQQWQLDYSRRQMTDGGYTTPTDFLQAVLNTGLLHHIPEEAWPPMTEEEKSKLKEYMNRDDVDPEIPF
ncbi:MAG TPA: hypothetical protein ENI79_02985 [Rhodospirillales bacterium]|nr:hypothetical protein [Rhodospirillales bacterium]